jgi:hypothetical protein
MLCRVHAITLQIYRTIQKVGTLRKVLNELPPNMSGASDQATERTKSVSQNDIVISLKTLLDLDLF